MRQGDVKCCYRIRLRKCSGEIEAVEELVLFSLKEVFPLCILEKERALRPRQSVPPRQSENLHLAWLWSNVPVEFLGQVIFFFFSLKLDFLMSSSLDSCIFQILLYCYVFLFPKECTAWNYRAFDCFPVMPCWFLSSPSNFAISWLDLTSAVSWSEYVRITLDSASSALFWVRGLCFLFPCSWTIKHLRFFCHCNMLQACHPQGSFVYSANFLTRWHV